MYSLSVNGVSYPILCGLCGSPIGERAEAGADGEQIGCSACGNWGDADEVGRLASEFVKYELQLMLNRKARDVAEGSKIMKFSGQTTNDKAYRFRIDLKL